MVVCSSGVFINKMCNKNENLIYFSTIYYIDGQYGFKQVLYELVIK